MMEFRLGKFFSKIRRKHSEEDHEEFLNQRRNILFSRFAFTALFVILIHTVQDLVAGLWMASIIDFSIWLMVLASLILNEAGFHRISKVMMLSLSNVMLLIYCSIVPRQNGVFLFFFPLIAISSIAFDPGQKKYRFGLIGISIVSLLLLVLTDFKLLGEISIPAEPEKNSLLINIASSSFLLIVCIDFMSRTNEESELRLRRLANEVQCKNNDLQKANDELDRFLYSTSHDLRAPISSIKGLIMLAKKETAEDDMKQYLAMMYDRTEKLDHFIHDIINYSRNARTEIAREPVRIKSVVEEVTSGFEFFEGAEHIQFCANVEDRTVYTDPIRLKVILNNLVSNSVKYHNPLIEHPRVEIQVKHGKTCLIIQVRDNGIGIEEHAQAKIFDMFYRGTDRSKGSGLGLYIVREVVERMGGKISISSALNEGTEFTVKLPVGEYPNEANIECRESISAEAGLYSTAEVV